MTGKLKPPQLFYVQSKLVGHPMLYYGQLKLSGTIHGWHVAWCGMQVLLMCAQPIRWGEGKLRGGRTRAV